MQKREQKAQTYFNHWLKEIYLKSKPFGFFVFELKHSRGLDYINFSEVKEHQIQALESASGSGFVYKISDSALGQKPFDCFALKGCPAYVVLFYPSSFSIISINTFLLEKERSKRKSLTEERASEISVKTIKI